MSYSVKEVSEAQQKQHEPRASCWSKNGYKLPGAQTGDFKPTRTSEESDEMLQET